MYNGIGLTTPRGSGTNGHVQRNLANLNDNKSCVPGGNNTNYRYAEEDLHKLDAILNKQPNKEILDHDRKRKIEVKCLEFEEILEKQGFSAETVRTKVDNYRNKLLAQNKTNLPKDEYGRIIARETHQIAEAQREKNAKLREAFNISECFVDGSSFSAERKSFIGQVKKHSNSSSSDNINNTSTIKSVLVNSRNMESESKESFKKQSLSGTSIKRHTKEDIFNSESNDAKLSDAASKDNTVVENEHFHKKKKKKRAHDRSASPPDRKKQKKKKSKKSKKGSKLKKKKSHKRKHNSQSYDDSNGEETKRKTKNVYKHKNKKSAKGKHDTESSEDYLKKSHLRSKSQSPFRNNKRKEPHSGLNQKKSKENTSNSQLESKIHKERQSSKYYSDSSSHDRYYSRRYEGELYDRCKISRRNYSSSYKKRDYNYNQDNEIAYHRHMRRSRSRRHALSRDRSVEKIHFPLPRYFLTRRKDNRYYSESRSRTRYMGRRLRSRSQSLSRLHNQHNHHNYSESKTNSLHPRDRRSIKRLDRWDREESSQRRKRSISISSVNSKYNKGNYDYNNLYRKESITKSISDKELVAANDKLTKLSRSNSLSSNSTKLDNSVTTLFGSATKNINHNHTAIKEVVRTSYNSKSETSRKNIDQIEQRSDKNSEHFDYKNKTSVDSKVLPYNCNKSEPLKCGHEKDDIKEERSSHNETERINSMVLNNLKSANGNSSEMSYSPKGRNPERNREVLDADKEFMKTLDLHKTKQSNNIEVKLIPEDVNKKSVNNSRDDGNKTNIRNKMSLVGQGRSFISLHSQSVEKEEKQISIENNDVNSDAMGGSFQEFQESRHEMEPEDIQLIENLKTDIAAKVKEKIRSIQMTTAPKNAGDVSALSDFGKSKMRNSLNEFLLANNVKMGTMSVKANNLSLVLSNSNSTNNNKNKCFLENLSLLNQLSNCNNYSGNLDKKNNTSENKIVVKLASAMATTPTTTMSATKATMLNSKRNELRSNKNNDDSQSSVEIFSKKDDSTYNDRDNEDTIICESNMNNIKDEYLRKPTPHFKEYKHEKNRKYEVLKKKSKDDIQQYQDRSYSNPNINNIKNNNSSIIYEGKKGETVGDKKTTNVINDINTSNICQSNSINNDMYYRNNLIDSTNILTSNLLKSTSLYSTDSTQQPYLISEYNNNNNNSNDDGGGSGNDSILRFSTSSLNLSINDLSSNYGRYNDSNNNNTTPLLTSLQFNNQMLIKHSTNYHHNQINYQSVMVGRRNNNTDYRTTMVAGGGGTNCGGVPLITNNIVNNNLLITKATALHLQSQNTLSQQLQQHQHHNHHLQQQQHHQHYLNHHQHNRSHQYNHLHQNHAEDHNHIHSHNSNNNSNNRNISILDAADSFSASKNLGDSGSDVGNIGIRHSLFGPGSSKALVSASSLSYMQRQSPQKQLHCKIEHQHKQYDLADLKLQFEHQHQLCQSNQSNANANSTTDLLIKPFKLNDSQQLVTALADSTLVDTIVSKVSTATVAAAERAARRSRSRSRKSRSSFRRGDPSYINVGNKDGISLNRKSSKLRSLSAESSRSARSSRSSVSTVSLSHTFSSRSESSSLSSSNQSCRTSYSRKSRRENSHTNHNSGSSRKRHISRASRSNRASRTRYASCVSHTSRTRLQSHISRRSRNSCNSLKSRTSRTSGGSSGSRSDTRSRSRHGRGDNRYNIDYREKSNTQSSSSSSSISSTQTIDRVTYMSRLKSRSPSIPRRRGSPSFLDRRRITSARKRPIPYHRKTSSDITSCSTCYSRSSSIRSRSYSASCDSYSPTMIF